MQYKKISTAYRVDAPDLENYVIIFSHLTNQYTNSSFEQYNKQKQNLKAFKGGLQGKENT